MWFQQPDAFTLVQFRLECGPDHLLKWFERSDLYYKMHEVTRCKQPLYFFMLFFIKMKLSSRLGLTHKRVTQKYRNSTLIKKKTALGSDRNWPILRIFWIGSDLKKWYRCIPNFGYYVVLCVKNKKLLITKKEYIEL